LTHHFVKFTPILASFKVENVVFLFTSLWPDKDVLGASQSVKADKRLLDSQ